jgi:SM-20-related protein
MTKDGQTDGLADALADGLGDGLSVGGEAATRPVSILPPHRVIDALLDEASVETLLELALSRQADFEPTRVGRRDNARLNPAFRTSLVLRPREALAQLFETRLRGLAPVLTAGMRLSAFEASAIELELVAHGDGAFYKRHIDTQTGGDAMSQRILSGVYYFNHRPKAFTGGALRLYAIGDYGRFIDVEPEHNRLLVFPSWAPHEVMPVSCPSGAFIDSRFAVNCWVRRRAPSST